MPGSDPIQRSLAKSSHRVQDAIKARSTTVSSNASTSLRSAFALRRHLLRQHQNRLSATTLHSVTRRPQIRSLTRQSTLLLTQDLLLVLLRLLQVPRRQTTNQT